MAKDIIQEAEQLCEELKQNFFTVPEMVKRAKEYLSDTSMSAFEQKHCFRCTLFKPDSEDNGINVISAYQHIYFTGDELNMIVHCCAGRATDCLKWFVEEEDDDFELLTSAVVAGKAYDWDLSSACIKLLKRNIYDCKFGIRVEERMFRLRNTIDCIQGEELSGGGEEAFLHDALQWGLIENHSRSSIPFGNIPSYELVLAREAAARILYLLNRERQANV